MFKVLDQRIENVNRYSNRQYSRKLYEALRKHDIDFKGIDDPNLIDDHSLAMEPRDQLMAEAYCDPAAAFGIVGLDHVLGIQNNIMHKKSRSEAQKNFCFFNLITDIQKHKPIVKKIATGEQAYPLGLTQIEVKNKTDDEVIEIILQKIMEKMKNCKKVENQPRTRLHSRACI